MQNWLKFSLTALLLTSCAEKQSAPFVEVGYADLPNWQNEINQNQVAYLNKVCSSWQKRSSITVSLYGSLKDWQNSCANWLACKPQTVNCLKQNFYPVKLLSEKPLFTGYYAPIFKGSKVKTPVFNTPLYAQPRDLVKANLELFDEEFKGKRLVGRVQNNRFVPYAKRAEIDSKGIQATPLVWVSEEDAFFMQVQGSGSIELIDGQYIHVAYGGNNGHKYHAIGRTLIKKGEVAREDMSMEAIRTWLETAPEWKKKAVLNTNPRYIFFTKGDGLVRGSFATELERDLSLAVDPSYVPLGAPVWVNTKETLSQNNLQKMMFATDTGGAIEGAVRGDIYFGKGEKAGEKAGVQNETGEMYIFIPRK